MFVLTQGEWDKFRTAPPCYLYPRKDKNDVFTEVSGAALAPTSVWCQTLN
jgi:hypothetical protein